MHPENEHEFIPRWKPLIENFEKGIVAALALLLVIVIASILMVVAYLFVHRLGTSLDGIENIADVQPLALRAFSGILLVLLGLELLDTVKVYFLEHSIRVEVILMVGLIAMGRHVLEIDLHHIEPLTLFGIASLILVLAISYFLMKRAKISVVRFGSKDSETGLLEK